MNCFKFNILTGLNTINHDIFAFLTNFEITVIFKGDFFSNQQQ